MSFLAAQPTGMKPQVLTTMSVQTSAYGVCIPMVWGTTRLTGNLIWYGDFVATEHNETQGGKGGGVTSTSYTYSAAFAMALAGVQVSSIPRVWSGKEKTTLTALGFDLMTGADGQSPWSYLTSKHPTQALNYPGIAYVGAGNFQLGSSSSLPNLGFEVVTTSAGVAGTQDAAPWTIVSDIFGAAGVAAGRIGSLTAYTNFCGANGLFLSPALTEQKRAADHLQEILDMTHTAAVPSEGVVKLVPFGDSDASGNGYTFSANVTPIYDLSDDDFLAVDGDLPIIIDRKANADAKNKLRVEFRDRDNEYATGVALAEDEAHVAQYGARPEETLKYDAIKSAAIASKVAYLKLQYGLYILNTYKFKLPWRYCLLEPMDIVTLTHSLPALDLYRVPVRITKVEEDEEGGLSIEAEDFPQGAGLAPVVAPQPTSGYSTDMNVAPGSAATPVLFEPPVSLAGQPELWLATSGGATYGGCDVWVSLDNVKYQRVGTLSGKSRHGLTTATLPNVADPDTTSTLAVDMSVSGGQLIGGTDDDRDLYNTLLWVGGEFISYKNATLTAANRYSLTSLRRGAYGSTIGSKAVGAKVVRCDDRVFRYSYDPALIGKTLYIKLQAYNIYGGAYQDLASLTATSYVVQGAPLGTVSGLALEQPFVGTTCGIKWNAYPGAQSYTVEVWAGAVKRRTVPGLTSTRFSYTLEESRADGGPYRNLEFRVFAVSANGTSGSGAVLTASNPQLGVPTGISSVGAGASISITMNRPSATDYQATRVWISATSGFDPAVTTPAYDGPDTGFTKLGLASGTWYARVAQYDAFGSDGLVTSGEFSIVVTGANGVRTVTSLPANPAAVDGELAIFLNVADASQRGIWGWDGSAWKFTRDGANLLANSVAADRLTVSNLAAITANMGAITSGSFTMDASGFFRAGATSYSAGTGIWFGYDGGAYKARIGSASGARMVWDGSSFNVYDGAGNLTISAGVVDYSRLTNKPSSLSAINSTESTKLAGIEAGATVGAPTGTNVGGTAAETVATKANGALQKAGDSITGRISMTVADGLFAGTDLNNGIYLGGSGLVGKKAGVTTFAVDTAGNAVFAGEIAAGSLDVEKLSGTTTTYSVAGTYTFTMPAGFTVMRLTVTGGGGGGGGGANDANFPGAMSNNGGQLGSGGGQGGTYIGTFTGLTPGATYTVIVGSGGNAGGTNGNIGVYNTPPSPAAGAGGASSVSGPGVSVSAAGGQPGEPSYFVSEATLAVSVGGLGGSGGGAGYPGEDGQTRNRLVIGTPAYGGSSAAGGAGAGGSGYVFTELDPYHPTNVAKPGQPGRVIIEAYNPNGIVKRSEWDTLIGHLNTRFSSYTWP